MNINKLNILYITVALLAGLAFGWLFFSGGDAVETVGGEAHAHESETETWTCSMHPQIRQNEPGKCPICGMDLIPVDAGQAGSAPGEIEMSETAVKLAQIQTVIVGMETVASSSKKIRLNGKIKADERRLSALTAHIPGRIEELKLNFTGEQVTKGQLIARIYSPDLVAAQKELLEAAKYRESNPALFNAAKEKLYRWKISPEQVEQIIGNEKPIEAFPLYAEASGIVQSREVSLGDYVQTGETLYDIQNLSKLWVVFDAYESDLQWISVGSKVNFTVAAFPGKTYETTISYIDPGLDQQRRVTNVRGEISNAQALLKPEMFVVGQVEVPAGEAAASGILVPRSAVLWTGERSVVYVQVRASESPLFRLQHVILGPSAGESYLVTEGLQAGDQVVVNGAFTIDAAAQLSGKQSMMNATPVEGTSFDHSHAVSVVEEKENEPIAATHAPQTFRKQLTGFILGYIELKNSLVEDDAELAKTKAQEALKRLKNVDMKLLTDQEAHMRWMELLSTIEDHLRQIGSTADIVKQRTAFKALSDGVVKAVATFGVADHTFFQQHCPMANDNKGADWLSLEEEILNPYYGDAMLSCGSVENTFTPTTN